MSNSAWTKGGATLFVLGVLQSCVYGQVYDSDGTTRLEGVKVDSYGYCSGSGCVAADHGAVVTMTGGSYPGAYVFDAYGDYSGASKVQLIGPGANMESVRLVFGPTDGRHLSQTVYHRPKYSTITSSISGKNKEYSVSPVQPLYLCTSDKPDTDKDGICDAAELRYATNPNAVDTDGDGFTDSEELFGMQCNGIDLRYYGASASHKDIFVYYDYYTAPLPAALTQVTQAFAAAPVMNYDGTKGINLHFIAGKQITAADQVPRFHDSIAGHPNWKTQLNIIKDKYMPGRFANVAFYVLFAKELAVPNGSGGISLVSGAAKGIPAHDAVITIPFAPTATQQAGTLMHEIGHMFGLMHGGNDHHNFKPNYLSVMNYMYQVGGLFRDGANGVLDYSRLIVDQVDESALRESCPSTIFPGCNTAPALMSGMAPLAPTSAADLARYRIKITPSWTPIFPVLGNADGPLDFNGSGVMEPGVVGFDLDLNGVYGVHPPSWNDWDHLLYKGHQDGGGTIGCPTYLKSYTPQLVSADAPVNELAIH